MINLDQITGPLLVFIDGQFSLEASQTECIGLEVKADNDGHTVVVHLSQDVPAIYCLHQCDGLSPEAPIALTVKLDAGVSTEIHEYVFGEANQAYQQTLQWRCEVAQGSHLLWLSHQNLSEHVRWHSQGEHYVEGQLSYHVETLGQSLIEAEMLVKLLAENAECHVHGLLVGQGQSKSRQDWRIEHLAPNTTCDMHYRALMGNNAQGSWLGHAHVADQAKGAKVTQMSRQMLFGKHARMHAKPELTIHCDEVACQHGATVGQLDEQALFYLRSRGLLHWQARMLLTWSFVQEVLVMRQASKHCLPEDSMLQQSLAAVMDHDGTSVLNDFWQGKEVKHDEW